MRKEKRGRYENVERLIAILALFALASFSAPLLLPMEDSLATSTYGEREHFSHNSLIPSFENKANENNEKKKRR